MITTRESINYQFSLIFGYSSPGDIIVGDVIGPGKLTKKKVNTLSEEVISFLRMFNAILRDYTGSELYSIEYELYNYDSNQSKIKIYPKSMILMPGRYKDCETLLLALKPELGFLNIHKSRDALNDLGKLFFEVEEFSNHPKLSKDENKLILQEFASRFSLKLFGELIENKWNKKLVGISSSLPTDKEMLDVFGSIVSNVVYSWDKEPIQVRFENSKFLKVKDPLQERASIDHLAYTISKPSANYIVNKSLELGKNLIALANTGTIDETKEKILIFISRQIKEEFNIINDQKNITFLLSEFYRLMDTLEKSFSNYLKSSREFIYSGQYEKIEGILQKFKISVLGKREYSDKDFYRELNEITIDFIMQNMQKKTSIIRASDLESSISYFSEIVDAAMVLVKQSLPIYLSRLRLRYTCANLISNVKKKLELEKKPVKVFGHRFLNDLQSLINKSIELSPLFTKKTLSYDDKSIIREFKRLVNDNLSTFFDDINLNISDVVSFVEVQMDSSRNLIRDHIEKFKTYSVELSYLLSYILRYSTINRFLKEHPEDEISDPVTFSNKFYRFLEKRVGGIQLNWKQFVLEWIKDYAKKFFKIEENREWKLNEIFHDFLNYLENRLINEEIIDSFLNFLDGYISKNANESNKNAFLEFYKQYEYCLGISTEFPKYIKKLVKSELSLMNFEELKLKPSMIVDLENQDSLISYLREKKIKYFSNLIPRPISIVLKHSLTEQERELFTSDLFHIFNFKYWGTKNSVEILDNFKEVYRLWLREK